MPTSVSISNSHKPKAPTICPRVLIVDDDTSIHGDYQKSLIPIAPDTRELEQLEAAMFGNDNGSAASNTDAVTETATSEKQPSFEITHAYQGREAVELVKRELNEGRRYAVAFIDVRMPPGWNGIETARHLWHLDPDIHIVICTAHANFEWNQTFKRLGRSDLHHLPKPFEPAQLRELAIKLARAWHNKHAQQISQS